MGELAKELLRMLKAPPRAVRHHPGRFVIGFCIFLVVLFGVILRLLL